MNRDRFIEWARHQLEFWTDGATVSSPPGLGWRAPIDPLRSLGLVALEDGTLQVQLITSDLDLRNEWAEIFRDVRADRAPWPPGPVPEGIGELEILSDATGQSTTLQFAWMFYGTNFLQEIPAFTAAISWLLLAAADIPNPIDAIDLDDE